MLQLDTYFVFAMEKEVDRSANLAEIERSVKNKFKWAWLEEKYVNGDYLADYVRKLTLPGYAYCKWCNDKIMAVVEKSVFIRMPRKLVILRPGGVSQLHRRCLQ